MKVKRAIWSMALAVVMAAGSGISAEGQSGDAFKVHRVGTHRSEACCVGDFNNDGKLDIVGLPFLYLAPDFKPVKICDVGGVVGEDGKGYQDDFMNVPLDVDGDGWLDVVTCTWFEKKCDWVKNPGPAGGTWTRKLFMENGNYEAGELEDVDGDGKAQEILPAVVNTVWYEVKNGVPTKHVVSEKEMTWGVGCGDINGDGRPDLVRPDAWFEAPEDPRAGTWTEHPIDIGNRGKPTTDMAQILVYDVNGDGLADLIGSAAHDYGLYWFEQVKEGAEIAFTRHVIDTSWSQVHSLALANLDTDDELELIAGKRFMAHNGGDPGEFEPLGVYWYDLKRKPDVSWTKHNITFDQGIGSGMNIAVADLDADGDKDIVVTGKWGGPVWFENVLGNGTAK
ncbi:MAG: VCBS repeat-containing protein [Candidatus Hydrogenedentes bacterium]|nr:VCBS repeat-containing protein [Candidatus Hydrogenedentota bacterium]